MPNEEENKSEPKVGITKEEVIAMFATLKEEMAKAVAKETKDALLSAPPSEEAKDEFNEFCKTKWGEK